MDRIANIDLNYAVVMRNASINSIFVIRSARGPFVVEMIRKCVVEVGQRKYSMFGLC